MQNTIFSTRQIVRPLVLGVVVAMACFVAGSVTLAAKTTEQAENYPDGKPHFSYTVNEDGQRDGIFKEFAEDGTLKAQGIYKAGKLHGLYKELHPNGKLKLKGMYKKGVLSGKYSEHDEKGVSTLTALYRNGKLHGARKRLDGRKVIAEEVWLEGQLILPKSASFLKKQFKAIAKAKIETVGEIPETTEAVVAKVKNESIHKQRENATRRLMMFRAACDLPFKDLQLDLKHTAHSEAGSMVLAKLGQIAHEPPKPPGVADDLFQFALEGTKYSNLLHDKPTCTMSKSVVEFMRDTDPHNVQRLGHRRWCMNPELLRTGFGKTIVDEHSSILTMWAFDNERKEVPDYDMFAFPARGVQPVSLLRAGKPYAWNCSFNPTKYRMPSDAELKVQVVPARFDAKRAKLLKGKTLVQLDSVHVSIEKWSYPPAVIFWPQEIDQSAGKSYWVEIEGVKHADGSPAKIGYLVSFVKL